MESWGGGASPNPTKDVVSVKEATMTIDRAQRLANKVVIITGGGTGIGLGIARSCAEEGAAVVLAQRRAAIAEKEAAALRAAGHRALGLGCDVSRRADVNAL